MGVFFLATSVWGGVGINAHCGTASHLNVRVQDHNGSDLNTTSVIQWVLGSPGLPDPNATNYLHSGTLYNSYNVGAGTIGDAETGKFDINTSAPSSSYLVIWENGGPATGSYYTRKGPYSSGAVTPTEVDFNASFRTSYLADVPLPPSVSASNYKLTWDGSSYQVAFTLTGNAPSSPNVEVLSTGWSIRVRKATDDWAAGKVYNSKSASITEDPNDPYFTAGEYYVAVAASSNYFGNSGWGTELNFQIPTGGGGGAVIATYNLTAAPADGIGLNAVTIVHNGSFNVDSDPVTSVSTIGDLVTAINAKAAGSVVTAIGVLENNQMQGVYITYDASGVPTYTPTVGFTSGADTALARLMQLQISVTQDVTVTFSQ